MAGWINSRQLEVIDFLREENHVLHESSAASGCGLLNCYDRRTA